jgi:hypothetical protein
MEAEAGLPVDGLRTRVEITQVAKTPTEIRSLARAHTEEAINCLVGVMRNSTNDGAKVSAAEKLMDRGWGKPAQPIENGDDGAFELIHRIERTIVNASDSNS